MSHRKAPLPDSMRRPKLWGVCRWCDKPTVDVNGKPVRLLWHPACVEAFQLIHWPAVTRKAVEARDHGICARCGCDADRQHRRWWHAYRTLPPPDGWNAWNDSKRKSRWQPRREQAARNRMDRMGKGWSGGAWQHDHIRPLVEANGDVSFWALNNIQTLCSACHVVKGTEDNRRRKEERRNLSLLTPTPELRLT